MRRVSSVVGVAAALITTSFLGAPDMAAAAPCGTTTLNNWLVTGFSCEVGNLTFSNFTYSPDGFVNVPANVVGVHPATTPLTEGPGVGFNAGWQNTGTTTLDALITFNVTAPAATPIVDFHLLLDGVVGSNVLDVATLNNAAGQNVATVSSSDNSVHSATFAPVTFLSVHDDILVGPGSTISSVDKQFSQVPGPVVGAGLPGLVAACGGLLALARRRRRQGA
jgi:hypothetical protein